MFEPGHLGRLYDSLDPARHALDPKFYCEEPHDSAERILVEHTFAERPRPGMLLDWPCHV